MRSLPLALVLVLATALPAAAEEYHLPNPWHGVLTSAATPAGPTPVSTLPNPWMAAALSGLSFPVVCLAAGAVAGSVTGPFQTPVDIVWGASTLLAGAGQLYAGDRTRAAWVSLGLPVSVVVSGFVGGLAAAAISSKLNPTDNQASLGGSLIVGGLDAVIYSGWAAWDAYHTAERAAPPSQ